MRINLFKQIKKKLHRENKYYYVSYNYIILDRKMRSGRGGWGGGGEIERGL